MIRRSGTARALAALTVVAAVLGACSGDGDEPTRANGTVTQAGKASVFDLAPGDCLDPPADVSGEIATIQVVPCADPHTQEVYAQVESTQQTYPGAEALAAEANGLCAGAMQDPPLLLSPDDGYFWSYLLPSFNSWNEDTDRTVVCVFVFPNLGSVTGSVVGAADAGTLKPGDPPPVSAVPPTLDDGG